MYLISNICRSEYKRSVKRKQKNENTVWFNMNEEEKRNGNSECEWYTLGLEKRFESSNLCSFATHSKLDFSLRTFAVTPALVFAHATLLQYIYVWSIMWPCSIKVEAVLLAALFSFLCPAILNRSRNSDRNKTSAHYKAIIQYPSSPLSIPSSHLPSIYSSSSHLFIHTCILSIQPSVYLSSH